MGDSRLMVRNRPPNPWEVCTTTVHHQTTYHNLLLRPQWASSAMAHGARENTWQCKRLRSIGGDHGCAAPRGLMDWTRVIRRSIQVSDESQEQTSVRRAAADRTVDEWETNRIICFEIGRAPKNNICLMICYMFPSYMSGLQLQLLTSFFFSPSADKLFQLCRLIGTEIKWKIAWRWYVSEDSKL